MADTMEQALDALNIASEIIGATTTITIDCAVYAHLYGLYSDKYNKKFNPKKDIHKLRGSPENPITLDDITAAFEKIQKQFHILREKDIGRSYFYEGMSFDPKKNKIEIYWGS